MQRPFGFALALAITLALVSTARAQMAGLIADPIASDDLDQYSAVLNLSPDQRRAMDEAHASYRASMQAFRDGPLAEHIEEHGIPMGISSQIESDVEKAQRDMRSMRSLASRLAQQDEAFLDQIAIILTEEQLPHLDIVRRDRSRDRSRAINARLIYTPVMRTDLSGDYRDLDLSTEQREALDVHAQLYEQRLTRALEEASEFVIGLNAKLATELAERSKVIPEDEQWRESSLLWRKAQEDMAAHASAIASLHRGFVRQLKPSLTRPQRVAIAEALRSNAYPNLPGGLGDAGSLIDSSLSSESTDIETKQALLAQRNELDETLSGIDEQLMDLADERRAAPVSHSLKMWSSEEDKAYYDDPDPDHAKRDALAARRKEVISTTADTVRAILTEAGAASLAAAETEGDEPTTPVRGPSTSTHVTNDGPPVYGVSNIPRDQLPGQFSVSDVDGGRFLPQPMPQAHFESLIERIEIDDSHEAIALGLYDGYLDAYAGLEASGGPVHTLKRREAQLFDFNATPQPRLPTSGDIDSLFAVVHEAIDAASAIEEEFFNDLLFVLGDEHAADLAAFRLERSRRRFGMGSRGGRNWFEFQQWRPDLGGRESPRIDMVEIATTIPLDDAQRPAFAALVANYERDTEAILRELYDVRLNQLHRNAVMAASHLSINHRGEIEALDMTYTDEQVGLRDRRDELIQLLIDRNRNMKDEIAQLLDDDQAAQLEHAYRVAAWPDAANDPGSVQALVDAVMALKSLTPDQRQTLGDLAIAYRNEHESLTSRLIDATRDNDGELKRRLQFERDELNDRTRRRLSGILDAEQIAEVPGLAEP